MINPKIIPDNINVAPRLFLKILNKSDSQFYFNLVDENRNFFLKSQAAVGDLTDLEEAQIQIEKRVQEYQTGNGVSYKIILDEKFVGVVALRSINWENRKGVVGYFLSEKETNKGILTKCLLKIVSIGFSDFKLNRIVAYTSNENLASNKLLEKVGFKKEGCLRQDFFVGGRFVDDNVYAILFDEWKSNV